MTVELLANIGEFVGGVAVLATLVYLALQVRQNNLLARTSAYQFWHDSNARAITTIAQGPTPVEVFIKGQRDEEPLKEDERFQFSVHLFCLMHSFEIAFLMYKDGLVDEEKWHRQRRIARFWLQSPGTERAMSFVGGALDRDFLEEIGYRPEQHDG